MFYRSDVHDATPPCPKLVLPLDKTATCQPDASDDATSYQAAHTVPTPALTPIRRLTQRISRSRILRLSKSQDSIGR
jgi:hypothetical protein